MKTSEIERVIRAGIRAIDADDEVTLDLFDLSSFEKYKAIRAAHLWYFVIGYMRGSGPISEEIRAFLEKPTPSQKRRAKP